jgi:hypothetical protein
VKKTRIFVQETVDHLWSAQSKAKAVTTIKLESSPEELIVE